MCPATGQDCESGPGNNRALILMGFVAFWARAENARTETAEVLIIVRSVFFIILIANFIRVCGLDVIACDAGIVSYTGHTIQPD